MLISPRIDVFLLSLIDHSCPDSPVHLVAGRREEPTHSAHPGTTITIRVDQPVCEYQYLLRRKAFLWLTDHLAPSLHDRSPGHEGPMVGGPTPIGNSVGEAARERQYLPDLTLSYPHIIHCRVQLEPVPVPPVADQRGMRNSIRILPTSLCPGVPVNRRQPVRTSIFSI